MYQIDHKKFAEKHVQVIYNPTSGKKNDRRQLIKGHLEQNGLRIQLYETKCQNDAMNFAMNFDISNCYALLVVGGDGTLHEAINGILRRPDGLRVPIAVLPNGSGDDLAHALGLGVGDAQTALSYLVEGQVLKIDVIKVLLDHENIEEVEETVASSSDKNPP